MQARSTGGIDVRLPPASRRTLASRFNLVAHTVLFLADDLGWSDVGFHGEETIGTPSLDRLAREGVELERFYTTPICSPTRAALMTRRDPCVSASSTVSSCGE